MTNKTDDDPTIDTDFQHVTTPSPPPSPTADEKDLIAKYNELLDTDPVLTKSITAAIVGGIGALLGSLLSSQDDGGGGVGSGRQLRHGQQKRRQVNWVEVLAFSAFGGLVTGPWNHYWFEWLEKYGPKSQVKSMLVDQLIATPPFLLTMFVFIDMTKTVFRELPVTVKKNAIALGPKLLDNWRFWPVVVLCTFRYLKKKYWPLSLNFASLAWTMYLIKRQKK